MVRRPHPRTPSANAPAHRMAAVEWHHRFRLGRRVLRRSSAKPGRCLSCWLAEQDAHERQGRAQGPEASPRPPAFPPTCRSVGAIESSPCVSSMPGFELLPNSLPDWGSYYLIELLPSLLPSLT